MQNVSLFVLFLGVVSACGGHKKEDPQGNHPDPRKERESGKGYKASQVLTYNRGQASSNAKYFLIGGSRHGANFAQEIIDQKKYWLKLGVKEEEISCFYVIPDDETFDEDRDQYLTLADDLSACFVASMKTIRSHFQKAKTDKFVYIYITSHGTDPITYRIEKEEDAAERDYFSGLKRDYPFLDQYYILLDALDSGTTGIFGIMKEFDSGEDPQNLIFSPKHLKRDLHNWRQETKKYLVLQGCHSGGFIDEKRNPYIDDTVRDVPNLTVLTASRYDRTSFGCQLDVDKTYYGNAFYEVISKQKSLPDKINWSQVHNEITRRIDQKEKDEGIENPSLPQFFESN